jgi:hypothetical protein
VRLGMGRDRDAGCPGRAGLPSQQQPVRARCEAPCPPVSLPPSHPPTHPLTQPTHRTGGVISEFVNPKYKDASKTAFKSSTRLECMMQVSGCGGCPLRLTG